MICLQSLEQTRALGQHLAKILPRFDPIPALLLDGELGAGKTTLTRETVLCLSGSENAEIASPSFTLVNIYPTSPQVAHFDLYRMEHGGFEQDLEDILFNPAFFIIMEWSCFLPKEYLPQHFLHLVFQTENQRQLQCTASGKNGLAALTELQKNLHFRVKEHNFQCEF